MRDVVRALASLPGGEDLYGEVLNIGSVEEVTNLHLAQRVKAATESSSDIVFIPYTEAYGEGFEDMPRRVPDLTKIERMMGWRPEATLDQILEDVIEHERSIIRAGTPSTSASVSP